MAIPEIHEFLGMTGDEVRVAADVSRLIRSQLYGVTSDDPFSTLLAESVVPAVGVMARPGAPRRDLC
jgi:hypothetical protein